MLPSPTAQSFLASIDIKHGPRELLTSFFVKAVNAIEMRGISFEVGTFKQLLEINQQHPDSWMPLTTTFRWDIGGVDDSTGVVFIGCNASGEPVATQAARHFDWAETNFKEEAESLRFFYSDPTTQKAEQEACVVTTPVAKDVTGSVGLAGGLWIRPDYRRLQLTSITPRLARAYALANWNIETMMAIMTKANIEHGLAKRNGFQDVSWGVQMHNSPTYPNGILDVGLARLSAYELVDDLYQFLVNFKDAP